MIESCHQQSRLANYYFRIRRVNDLEIDISSKAESTKLYSLGAPENH